MLLKHFANILRVRQQWPLGLVQRSCTTRAYINCIGDVPLVYRSLGQQLQRTVERYGDRLALIACQEHECFTFAQANERAERLMYALRQLGLRRGEHLGIWAPNTAQWYEAMLASALGGYPLVCLNPAWQAPELEYALRKAKVKVLITMEKCGKQDFHAVLRELLPQVTRQASASSEIKAAHLPALSVVLMRMQTRSDDNEFLNYDALVGTDVACSPLTQSEVDAVPAESPCSILFTSGTTGQPKAAMLTHFNCVNECLYFGKSLRMHEGNKKICVTVPLFHVFGLSLAMAALRHGVTMVLPAPFFNAATSLDVVEQEHCQLIVGTPTMYVDMMEQQAKRARRLDSLQLGLVGGSPCSPEIYRQVQTALSIADMRIAYGMTESSSAIFAQDALEPKDQKHDTVGRLYPHAEAKVVNAKGETVAFGQPGELLLRGYFTMHGYFDDAAKTQEVLSVDGWLKTGDEFILEADGTARVVGRKKDVIIRGGENIYPKEIEDFLQTHPHILEAQVVGVPDKRMGEEICAYVRLRGSLTQLDRDDLKSFCRGKIAHFKVPRYVRVLQEFPKTVSGKIQKFKLKAMFETRSEREAVADVDVAKSERKF